jgi:adenosylhomocysteinase
MSASRMKNLILLILTLCALGLLCIVVPNRLAQTHEQRQMLQELKTLYESYGLSVLLDELPRSPVLYSVELSEDGAQTAAQALLGAKAAPAGESGFESTYESELGTLHITRTGGFSAVMTGGSRVRSSEKAAEKLLRAMDFQYQTLTREQTETGAVQIRTSQTLLGVPVLEPGDITDPKAFDLVLDCAAAFSSLTPTLGFVELTRSGVPKYAGKNCPVYVADAGRIKRIETCLGTGESYFRALTQLGYGNWTGKRIVIFGSGKVGTGLITYAHRYGCRVSVVTRPGDIPDRISRMRRTIDIPIVVTVANHGTDYARRIDDGAAIAQAVTQADAVVTATGIAGAATLACPADVFVHSHAVLANMGVEDEYGPGVPDERVLEAKRPVNFILKDPTLMKYIDATMALHNEGAVVLVTGQHPAGLIEPGPETEERLLDVARREGTIAEELAYI